MMQRLIKSYMKNISSLAKKELFPTEYMGQYVLFYPIKGLIISVYSFIPIALYQIIISPYLFSSDHLLFIALLYTVINICMFKTALWQEFVDYICISTASSQKATRNPQAMLILLPIFSILFYIAGLMQMLKYGLTEIIFFTPIFSTASSAFILHYTKDRKREKNGTFFQYFQIAVLFATIFIVGYYLLPIKYSILMLLAFLLSFLFCIRISKQHPIIKNQLCNIHIFLTEVAIFFFLSF